MSFLYKIWRSSGSDGTAAFTKALLQGYTAPEEAHALLRGPNGPGKERPQQLLGILEPRVWGESRPRLQQKATLKVVGHCVCRVSLLQRDRPSFWLMFWPQKAHPPGIHGRRQRVFRVAAPPPAANIFDRHSRGSRLFLSTFFGHDSGGGGAAASVVLTANNPGHHNQLDKLADILAETFWLPFGPSSSYSLSPLAR